MRKRSCDNWGEMGRSLLRSTTEIRMSIRLESATCEVLITSISVGTLATASRILLVIVVKGESLCVKYKSTHKEEHIGNHTKKGKEHERETLSIFHEQLSALEA